MTRLRLALPPLESLTSDTELEFAQLDRKGHVSHTGISTLGQLGQRVKSQAVECFLHPMDTVLTRIELPPLSASRIDAAVTCAAQALILGPSEQMHVAHSARDTDGQVHLSWLPKAVLDRLGQLLGLHGLKLGGLYPAPYRLAVPAAGQVNGCVVEGQLLLRFSLAHGAVEPLVEDRLEALAASGESVLWPVDHQRWNGAAPGWGLHAGVGRRTVPAAGWGRALGCCALAVGVWVAGLNLYAAREVAQGQQLKQQMSQRVKHAFPELPVILNPLQQARQQLAIRQGGGPAQLNHDFAYLVQQAAMALPFMAGSVQQLTFSERQLQLQMTAEATPAADGAVQAALSQAGLSAHRNERIWTLSALAEPASGEGDSSVENDDE
ncbi:MULTISPECIES: type II secretion system protein GspL [unclassified Pseudomonas]|uniref:type II secretion system protein GspL n=1 Tax=unclassified Pseudomonas TaxID=196821 RepID=UPI000480AB4E|nr:MULTISPECIES: type II secretion system protein GspL [unclassified Pseudomonas]SCX36444.1 general secretion pathway protein L [Pseudomonas sp. NFACC25]SME98461.1 type II secretion system protein L (GspL) [Pseudomonas sp. LAMO17WK12:I1]